MSRRRTALEVEEYVTNFQARVLHDAWLEGTAAFWERRARMFEWAAPRAGDFLGRATNQDRTDQAIRCAAAARACRNRGRFAHGSSVELVETLVAEAAA